MYIVLKLYHYGTFKYFLLNPQKILVDKVHSEEGKDKIEWIYNVKELLNKALTS
jgi:hypothetical protein